MPVPHTDVCVRCSTRTAPLLPRQPRHVQCRFLDCSQCRVLVTPSWLLKTSARHARLLKSVRLPTETLCLPRPERSSHLRTSPKRLKRARLKALTSSSRVTFLVPLRPWKTACSRLMSVTLFNFASSTAVLVPLLSLTSTLQQLTQQSSLASTCVLTTRLESVPSARVSMFVSTALFTTHWMTSRTRSRACSSLSTRRSRWVPRRFARSSSPPSSELLLVHTSALVLSAETLLLVYFATERLSKRVSRLTP